MENLITHKKFWNNKAYQPVVGFAYDQLPVIILQWELGN